MRGKEGEQGGENLIGEDRKRGPGRATYKSETRWRHGETRDSAENEHKRKQIKPSVRLLGASPKKAINHNEISTQVTNTIEARLSITGSILVVVVLQELSERPVRSDGSVHAQPVD